MIRVTFLTFAFAHVRFSCFLALQLGKLDDDLESIQKDLKEAKKAKKAAKSEKNAKDIAKYSKKVRYARLHMHAHSCPFCPARCALLLQAHGRQGSNLTATNAQCCVCARPHTRVHSRACAIRKTTRALAHARTLTLNMRVHNQRTFKDRGAQVAAAQEGDPEGDKGRAQDDLSRDVEAQLPRPSHFCRLVRPSLSLSQSPYASSLCVFC
jgi:hypothetical protein